MRFAIVTLFVLVIAAVALASPAKGVASTCARACQANYDPICAKAKNGSKERLLTFGNQCVMDSYNCEHKDDQYEKKSTGECAGKVSVRLQ